MKLTFREYSWFEHSSRVEYQRIPGQKQIAEKDYEKSVVQLGHGGTIWNSQVAEQSLIDRD